MQAERQAQIENLMRQADLAISLEDWGLARENLTGILNLDAHHKSTQPKLRIVKRKIAAIEQIEADRIAQRQTAADRKAVQEMNRASASGW